MYNDHTLVSSLHELIREDWLTLLIYASPQNFCHPYVCAFDAMPWSHVMSCHENHDTNLYTRRPKYLSVSLNKFYMSQLGQILLIGKVVGRNLELILVRCDSENC